MISGFHIEPTNICVLKCSGCSRTQFLEQFGHKAWANRSIDLSALKKFMDIDLTNVEISLCGNEGDPIYHPQLIEMVQFFKSRGAHVVISTNGSYKKPGWWKDLMAQLDNRDTIEFAIDGMPDTFTEYRVNAHWESIEAGLKIAVAGPPTVVWKMIPFKFNQHQIDQVEEYASNIGVDWFRLLPSERFVDNDPLEPDASLVHPINFIKRGQELYTGLDPQCASGKTHYITAGGFYVPCCWMADYRFYFKSEFYKEQKKYNISNTTMSTIIANTQDFYNNIVNDPAEVCKFNCAKI